MAEDLGYETGLGFPFDVSLMVKVHLDPIGFLPGGGQGVVSPCLVRHERFVFDFEGHAPLVRFREVGGVVVLVWLVGIVAVIFHHSRRRIPLLLRNYAVQ